MNHFDYKCKLLELDTLQAVLLSEGELDRRFASMVERINKIDPQAINLYKHSKGFTLVRLLAALEAKAAPAKAAPAKVAKVSSETLKKAFVQKANELEELRKKKQQEAAEKTSLVDDIRLLQTKMDENIAAIQKAKKDSQKADDDLQEAYKYLLSVDDLLDD